MSEPTSLTSNPRTEMRERMLADEERSEQAFEELSLRIALEAHEDRLKLWDDVERLTRERDSLRSAVIQTEALTARLERIERGKVEAERDRMRAALRGAKALLEAANRGSTHWQNCFLDHPVCAALHAIECALSGASPSAVETTQRHCPDCGMLFSHAPGCSQVKAKGDLGV